MSRPTLPLSGLKRGERARVLSLRGGREFQHRILSMGLSMGCEVEVMQTDATEAAGPVVVRAGETRLMLGHGMAEKVLVRVI